MSYTRVLDISNTRIREYIPFVYNVIDLITKYNPSVTEQEIMSSDNIDHINEDHYIIPYMNIDIMVFNNNTYERIDRAHFHIPYLLKPRYLKKYIETAIVHKYFTDSDVGINRVNVKDCYIRSNAVESEQEIDMSRFNMNETDERAGDHMTFGDLILSLAVFDIDWGVSLFEEINPSIKVCVNVDDFRANDVNIMFSDINQSLNFWYYLGSAFNSGSSINEDGYNNTQFENDVSDNQTRVDDYFAAVQPFHHHTSTPITNNNNTYPILLDEDVLGPNYANIGEWNIVFEDDLVFIYGEDELSPTHIERIDPINCRTDECPVCYNSTQMGDYYTCDHGICNECYDGWSGQGKTTCPVCRSSQRGATHGSEVEVIRYAT